MYNDVMKRTTIVADEQTLERLRGLARQRGVSFAQVAREALEDKADDYRPQPESLGSGRSNPAHTGATKGSRRAPPRSWR
jgi:hypothetical protein